ncbi:hypothetical protein BRC68_02575 [Halobacteriales archaeon QH_6_64_20]|nr:MAG: hypothetical protein BRC68_02575 [Halobacteriales archaeon QH_6_64_20]
MIVTSPFATPKEKVAEGGPEEVETDEPDWAPAGSSSTVTRSSSRSASRSSIVASPKAISSDRPAGRSPRRRQGRPDRPGTERYTHRPLGYRSGYERRDEHGYRADHGRRANTI